MTAYGSRLVIAVVGVGIGFLLLIGILYLIRRRNGPSPFLRGGKNRQPRLQVLDAAAVDARRRIVLIRRDNVEHLVMIGGPTDVVIESGIGAAQDGETLGRPVAEALPASQPTAEHRLEAPVPQPRITASRSDAPRATDTPIAEPQRKAPASIAQPAETPSQLASAKPREKTVAPPMPVAQTVKAAPTVVEPVIIPSAPAVKVVAEPAKSSEPNPQTSHAPDIGAASDALDAVRRRVFQPTPDRTPAPEPKAEATALPPSLNKQEPAPSAAQPTAVNTQPPAAEAESPAPKPRSLGSDFDRILEEEMANNLSIQSQDNTREAFTPMLPKRDPANPKVTGATPEPALQNEIARIFGEMSVTRDDR